MKYAGVANGRVIIIEEKAIPPKYPPTNDGIEVETVECDETVQLGDVVENGVIVGTYVPKEPQPTQADRIEENQLILMEAMATQYEESLENRLNDQEVQATIYETLLEMQGGN